MPQYVFFRKADDYFHLAWVATISAPNFASALKIFKAHPDNQNYGGFAIIADEMKLF